ncbi:MAG: PKD domain-containing protein [Phycisphaerae bacterium]|nr:PKD domain-containing protein [Phycisphaerae bacterium]
MQATRCVHAAHWLGSPVSRLGLVGGFLAAMLVTAAPAAADGWWHLAWAYRCPVTVADCPQTQWSGDDVAVVTFRTAGKAARDGSDVRVVTAGGRARPCNVLMIGPGDRMRVAFAVQPDVRRYYVYFGCADPPRPRELLQVNRGILLHTWRYAGGRVATLKQAKQIIEQRGPKDLVGADFVDRVFLGHTMFGADRRVARLFTGRLKCPRDGEYLFALSSRNASFLLVDGQLVVGNGGRHGPQRAAQKSGTVTLSRGLHTLQVYHVSSGGDPVIVAAWRPPGRRRVTVIPPAAFAPVCRGKAGPIRMRGRPRGVDFRCEHAGETFCQGRYYQRYVLTVLRVGDVPRDVTWTWDFGDGQTSEGTRVEHVYLTDGLRDVSVRSRTGMGVLERTHRLAVTRPWRRQAVRDIDAPSEYAPIVAQYDFAALDGADAAEAVVLLHHARADDAAMKAGAALADRELIAAPAADKALPLYAELLRKAGRAQDAATMLRKAAANVSGPAVASELLVRAGRIALDALHDADRAERLFRRVLEEYAALTTAKPIRAARIGLGDCHRARGDGAAAAKAYREAGPGALGRKTPAVARGSFARQAEAWTREGEYQAAADVLERWGWLLPADRLEGNLSLLRVRLLIAQKRYDEAVWRATTLVGANPDSAHAPQLLLQAARAHVKSDQPTQARAMLKRLAADYPESPLAERATDALDSDE